MSNCPFKVKGCPGFSSKAPMSDLCDDCYEGRRAEGETEETKEPFTCEDYMEEQGERDVHERRGC